ncbi:MAG: hypothetical protein JSS74_02795 [Actinobacteria bacterium]|nr:hypothetical protein [Actinomycetota bacterium]
MIGTVLFFALAIMGLGMLSLFTEQDIISLPRLGQLPGIVGMAFAVLAFAMVLWLVLADPRPSFVASVFLALIAALVHVGGVWAVAVIEHAGAVKATAVAGQLVLGGASAVIVVAALLAAWVAIALRRTTARAPHWPWENGDDRRD